MLEKPQAQVDSLLSAWGYAAGSIGRVQPILDVFQVETADGTKNLKWTRLPDGKLEFIIDALHYLREHGFPWLRTPIPTLAGRAFLVQDNQHYLLSDWIEGEQADLSNAGMLQAACARLALFHRASRGYKPPPGTVNRPYWGHLLQTFELRCEEMSTFPAQAAARGHITAFDREIEAETEYYMKLAVFARDLLSRSAYRRLAGEAAETGSLCHGDVAARNFIIAPDGEIYLIDFDSLRQDLPLADLWKLYRRTMKDLSWDVEHGLAMLAGYEGERPLSGEELEVLLALIAFPEKYWRLANRFYGGCARFDAVQFHRKLRKYTARRQTHARFLRALAALCRQRGARSAWPAEPFASTPPDAGRA